MEWRQAGGVWQQLVALSAITGPAGAAGATGATGPAGSAASATVVRQAAAEVPALLLGATYDAPIVWQTAFPNANYTVELTRLGGLIGRASVVVKSGTKTATGLTVTVTASLAVSAGSIVLAQGYL